MGFGIEDGGDLSGTGDSQRDSRARIDSRDSFAIETPFFIARHQADSHESLEFPIRTGWFAWFARIDSRESRH